MAIARFFIRLTYRHISYPGKSLRYIAIAWLMSFLVIKRSFNSKILSSLVKVPTKAIDNFNELSTSKDITPIVPFESLSYSILKKFSKWKDPIFSKIYSRAENVIELNTDTLLNVTMKDVALVADSNVIEELLGYSQLLPLKLSSEKKNMTIASHYLIRRRCR